MYIVDFATRVSRIKWFSSSYSAKGVSFKFQIDAWYSNSKSTESNDFHRLAVQKVFPSNFQIDAWYSNPVYWIKWFSSSCSSRGVSFKFSDRCMIFKTKVYWIKWFSSSCSAKGVSFKFQIDAWYSKPKSTESNDFHRLAGQKVSPSNFQIAMAFCFLPVYVTFSSFAFNERLSY